MNLVLVFLAMISLATLVSGVLRAHARLRPTTLRTAWRWSLLATLGWSAVWGVMVLQAASPAALETLWYLATLLALCPPMAVLGARRPGIGVWTLFVILPMLAVLGWPGLTVLSGDRLRPLALEPPALLAFVLVLLMGAGNYVGTRFTLSAGLYVLGLCLAVAPASTVSPLALQEPWTARQLATICLGLAAALALRSTATRNPAIASEPDATGEPTLRGVDRVWHDYRNTFGIVWARRFQDRLNGIAQQQNWPARLDENGLTWTAGITSAEIQAATGQIDQTVRWLLRRFVDPEWIDERLTSPH